jgi:hypothetical protein
VLGVLVSGLVPSPQGKFETAGRLVPAESGGQLASNHRARWDV